MLEQERLGLVKGLPVWDKIAKGLSGGNITSPSVKKALYIISRNNSQTTAITLKGQCRERIESM